MKVAIVGFGMMGRQIAQLFAQHGHEVRVTDENPEVLKTGVEEIMNGPFGLRAMVQKGKLTENKAKEIFSKVIPSNSIQEITADIDIAIEAVYENLKLKQEIFNKLDASAPQNALLASNTSTLSIGQMAIAAKAKDRILGLHFFNPAQISKLVEVVKTRQTSHQTIDRAVALILELGKHPIVTVDEPGFVANRLGLSLYMEASRMLEEGIANVKDIDTAMKLGFNHPMGPFELADFVGLDTRLRNLESLFNATGDEKWIPPRTLRQMVNNGYLGDPQKKKESKGGYLTMNNSSTNSNMFNPFIAGKQQPSQ